MTPIDYESTVTTLVPEAYRDDIVAPEAQAVFEEGRQLVTSALSRAASDPAFRQQLIETPKQALEAYYEELHAEPFPYEEFPIDIRFVEPVGDLTFVLPPFEDPEVELSDEELEAVAGGGPIAAGIAAAAAVSNVGCLAFGAGVATVALIVWVASS